MPFKLKPINRNKCDDVRDDDVDADDDDYDDGDNSVDIDMVRLVERLALEMVLTEAWDEAWAEVSAVVLVEAVAASEELQPAQISHSQQTNTSKYSKWLTD